MGAESVLKFFPKVGEGVSWITLKIIQWLSTLGINTTPVQSKIFTILVFGAAVYLIFSFVDKARKLLKWGLIILFVILIISVISSIFI